MIYCAGYTVSFQEVPDEISLVLLISECRYKCKGCHSPELQVRNGRELTYKYLEDLLSQYKDAVTCVCFMGEGADISYTAMLANHIRNEYHLKTALYTGSQDFFCPEIDRQFDYIKLGQYIERLGGLDKETTNQRMYQMQDGQAVDITNKFWKKYE